MSTARVVGSLIGALFVAACGTTENNAWMTGVPRQEVTELRSALVAQKHATKFYQYQRQQDGSIIVSTDVGTFQARRVRGKWDFTPVGFVGAATG